MSISIQVQGVRDRQETARRGGANAGDKIYVSGTLGDAAIALRVLGLDSHLGDKFGLSVSEPSAACRQYFADAYFRPEPQLELSAAAGQFFTSCIDISDGLQGDLQHILDASEVAANIRLAVLPFSDSALACVSPENRILAALFGGDDYELCFTVAEGDCAELESISAAIGIHLTQIGEIVAGNGIQYLDSDDSPIELAEQAFQHFSAGA